MGSNNKIKFKGQLDRYFRLQVFVGILWLIACVISYSFDLRTGIFFTVFLVLYVVLMAVTFFTSSPKIAQQMVEFGAEYSQVQREMLKELEVPYGLLDNDGTIMWANNKFSELVEKDKVKHKDITSIFPEIGKTDIDVTRGDKEFKIKHEGKSIKIILKRFALKEAFDNSEFVDVPTGKTYFISIYMFDETRIDRL